MTRKDNTRPDLQPIPMLLHETLYVGIDIGKLAHVAGFVSPTLLARHQRFEACPALSFENSREGFRALVDRISTYVPLTQVYAVLEVTGHYHRALLQYLQEMEIPVYVLHVQKRQKGLLKTDKRDALGLANHLYNQLEKGIQVGDPLQVVRRLAPPTPAAAQLRGMVQHRQELIAESTQRKNKLTAICDEIFPEFTRVFHDPNGQTALVFRSRFPTPVALATASLSALQEARGKTRQLSDARLLELQRLASVSIGTTDTARLRGLIFEQQQLIEEYHLICKHLESLEAEMMQVVEHCREGQILASIPGIGPLQAAILVALIGNIANFDKPGQLKSYCGWVPAISQSGTTLDQAKLSPRGARLLKHTIYLAVWKAIQLDCEWARLYERLVPIKCRYDEKRRAYVGRGRVIGRIAGQMLSVAYSLLKKDQETLSKLSPGAPLPEPVLYDPEIHRKHRAGQYQAPSSGQRPRKLIELPPH
jgi:transposase